MGPSALKTRKATMSRTAIKCAAAIVAVLPAIWLAGTGTAGAHTTSVHAVGGKDQITITFTVSHSGPQECNATVNGVNKSFGTHTFGAAGDTFTVVFPDVAPGPASVNGSCHGATAIASDAPVTVVGEGVPETNGGSCPAEGCQTVSLSPFVGGVTVHIHDKTGKSGTCRYDADWYHSLPFFLRANGNWDLVVVPSVPESRNWDVTVSCTNGFSTNTTLFY
jgi:hypothetical protein